MKGKQVKQIHTISQDGRSFGAQEPPKPPRDPYYVPEALRADYEAANVDPIDYFGIALREVSAEHAKGQIIDQDVRERTQREHLPEVMKRAEHYARLMTASAKARAAADQAERLARREQTDRCPVCSEMNPPVERHYATHLPREGWRACESCAAVAESLWAEQQRSETREERVRAALNL
ncbi:hypothetical protein [Agromyces sp. SYSU T00194]|uniref:hypothetical protein n=1 Tax=Agromyces chitinivorans TaxID=3158560 RepID=UPI00339155CF